MVSFTVLQNIPFEMLVQFCVFVVLTYVVFTFSIFGAVYLSCYLMVTSDAGKKVSKAPKIQRLVTPLTIQRKRSRIAEKKKRIAKKQSEAAEYHKLLAQRLKEQRDRRSESLAKRRSKLSSVAKAAATSA
jgi:hypothetical protein